MNNFQHSSSFTNFFNFSPIIKSCFMEVQSTIGFEIKEVKKCFLAGGTCNLDLIHTFISGLLPHLTVRYFFLVLRMQETNNFYLSQKNFQGYTLPMLWQEGLLSMVTSVAKKAPLVPQCLGL